MQLRSDTRQGAVIALAAAAASIVSFAAPVDAGGKAIFTSAQATSGAREYSKSCAACHGAALQGVSAPSLKGKTSGIAQQSVAQVYSYMSQQMPLTKPAGLSSSQYLGIMAYILKQNGHPPGSARLTVASARSTQDMVNP